MPTNRPFVLTIAGFDPSGGAGVLADIKTFEQHRVYGLAINTANTIQTEKEFVSIEWTAIEIVIQSIETLFKTYSIQAVKIGIVPSLEYLKTIVCSIKYISPTTKIVWDTVLKSTTDFNFLEIKNQQDLEFILEHIELITPNYNEALQLGHEASNIEKCVNKLSLHCSVLLKGGHNPEQRGTDYLYSKDRFFKLVPTVDQIFEKHGSGCVLSAAIVANIALEQDLLDACKNAKFYTENYLLSHPSLLGHHYA